MSVTTKEHLSAVLDGEAGDFEQRRILDELEKEGELQSSLSCYALIGETLRNGKQSSIVGSDFLKGIHDEIHAEPEYHHIQAVEKKVNNRHWERPVAGLAVAASIAALAVVGTQTFLAGNPTTSGTSVVASETTHPIKTLVSKRERYNHPDEKTRHLYKRYVDSHREHATRTISMVPLVRVVSYNTSY